MHYAPFYLMGRQLFLHHYLPAHLASSLVAGALLEFVFNVEPMELEEAAVAVSKSGKKTANPPKRVPARQSLSGQNLLASWAAAGVIMIVVIGGWYYFLPLTYGYPGLSVDEVMARKWLGYDLHFAK
jgi:dolichyl-phosphate-mannose-protein mannosyltransferase